MATTKPKKQAKKRELDLTRVLSAVDNKNYEFYDTLTAAELKEFSPYVLLRYVSNIAATNSDVQEWFIEKTNELVNKHHWTLSKNHKKLLWQLYAATGAGIKSYHPYLSPLKSQFDKFEKLLSELHPTYKMADIKVLASLMTNKEKIELFDNMGFDNEDRKKFQ